MSCPVCYANDTSLTICWNSHALCDPCYRRMMSSPVGHANRNCAECRVPMFSWVSATTDPCSPPQTAHFAQQTLPTPQRFVVIPPQRRSAIAGVVLTQRHCSVCRMTDHDRRTCPQRQQQEASRRVRASAAGQHPLTHSIDLSFF